MRSGRWMRPWPWFRVLKPRVRSSRRLRQASEPCSLRVERVPLHDSLEIIAHARKHGIRLIGPGFRRRREPWESFVRGSGRIYRVFDLPKIAFKPAGSEWFPAAEGRPHHQLVVCSAGFGISTAFISALSRCSERPRGGASSL